MRDIWKWGVLIGFINTLVILLYVIGYAVITNDKKIPEWTNYGFLYTLALLMVSLMLGALMNIKTIIEVIKEGLK